MRLGAKVLVNLLRGWRRWRRTWRRTEQSVLLYFVCCRPLYALDFTDFSRLCADPKSAPLSLEACLQSLHNLDPKFFSSYTLMRQSLSLQEATTSEPRAIVFGESAELVITFNGHMGTPGGSSIELMHWVPDVSTSTPSLGFGRFEFRELFFEERSNPRLSEANPPRCRRCHGEDPGPLWARYPVWPGAYGGHDDLVPDVNTVKSWSDNAAGTLKPFFLQQALDFETFLKSRPAHPRYRFLAANVSIPQFPYSASQVYDRSLRPNLRLGKAIAWLQARQIMSMIVTQRNSSGNGNGSLSKDPLLLGLSAALAQCHRRYGEPRAALLALGQETEERDRAAGLTFDFLPWDHNDSQSGLPLTQLLLRSLGISQHHWTPDPFSNSYQYFDGEKNISYYVLDLLASYLRGKGYALPVRTTYSDYSLRDYGDEFAEEGACANLDSLIFASSEWEKTFDLSSGDRSSK